MGYRAPSAKDIYRYAFRLDRQNRSLTDGFSLSIVFVNDGSPVCREFISRYFVDLCHRTADRIRIIFFSDLPESNFEDIARQMNSSSKYHKSGMLGAVIESTLQKPLDRSHTELLHRFLEALRLRHYREVDWLLSRISDILGPRYADALYRLVREHRYGDVRDVEVRIRALISELQNLERRSRRDPFRRMYDERWRDLTPNSLTPIDAPERTRELSFDMKMNTAMPGTGETMRFAARLGIGRHVPCFVFFTDVGELSVDVFPVGELSADETYDQLRVWIDRFYEENRVSVDKWNQVERDIATFTNSINQPLTTLRNWISKSDSLWNELCLTAQLIVKLSAALSKPEMHKSVIDELKSSSGEGGRILSECQMRFTKLQIKGDEHESKRQCLESIISKLDTASDFAQVYDAFYFASREHLTPSKFMDSNGVLRRAMNMMGVQRQMINAPPEKVLFVWWRQVRENIPSLKQFKRARKAWSFVTDQKAARAEYATLLNAVFALPLSDTTEAMTERTRLLLADIVGVSPHSSDWDTAFSAYSGNLTPFFHQVRNNAPEWIDRSVTDLKISDVLPFRNRDPIDFQKILVATKDDDPLRRMIRKVTAEWPKQQAKIVSESKKVALQCRDKVLAAFVELREESLDLSIEEAAVYSNCLRNIRALRERIEKKLTDLANSSYDPAVSPHLVNVKDIERLTSLLDEYDRTVNKLIYPYKRDRRVQSVKLPAPVPQVLRLKMPKQTKPSDRRRKELEEATRNSAAGPSILQDVQNRSYTMIPTARLVRELNKQGMIQEFADNQEQAVFAIIENLEETLYKLRDYELYGVWSTLTESTVEAKSRKAIIDMILAITGTIPAKEKSIDLANDVLGGSQLQSWPTWIDEVLNPSSSKSCVDVGIVIALEEEFQELAPQIKTRPYYNSDIKQYYYLFEYSSINETLAPYRCVVTFMGSMGPTDAGIVGDRLIAQFNPALIVSIGIAGSMDKDVLVGNVIVADQTDEYLASSKAVQAKDKQDWDIQFSGNPYKSDPTYVAHAMHLKYANQDATRNWQRLGKKKLQEWLGLDSTNELIRQNLIGDVPEIQTGHIASGPIVGAANQFVQWLKKKRDRKLLALEMESVGVLNAAHKRAVSSLIIRGISDYSDERKLKLDKIGRGALRRYAMNNALRLLWVLMDLELIDRNM